MNYKKQLYVFMFGMVMTTSLFVVDQAQAEIFKCVNQKGAVYYNDKPCPEKDTETQIKNAKDPKGVTNVPQVSSDFQVDENITHEELSTLRNQQRVDFMRGKAEADEGDEEGSLSENNEPLDAEG